MIGLLRKIAFLLVSAVILTSIPSCSDSWQATPWLDANGDSWAAFRLEPPDGEPVLFVCRAGGSQTVEYEQGIVFPGDTAISPLPYNSGGKIEIEAFWHDDTGESGPFVRLRDRWGEYLVDYGKQEISQIVRKDGRAFVARISEPSAGYSFVGTGRDMEVFVGKNRAKEMTGILGEGVLFAHIRR